MSRWRLIDKWSEDLPGLSDDRLLGRIRLARSREAGSEKKGRHQWRQLKLEAEAEWERRHSSDA